MANIITFLASKTSIMLILYNRKSLQWDTSGSSGDDTREGKKAATTQRPKIPDMTNIIDIRYDREKQRSKNWAFQVV